MDDKPYTVEQARLEIGNSTSWDDARASSLKKWGQIRDGDEETYRRTASCGYCIVLENRLGPDDDNDFGYMCPMCPMAESGVCSRVLDEAPRQVIKAIHEAKHPEEKNAQ